MKKTILSTLCFLLVSCFMFFTDAGTRIVVLGSSTAAGAGVSDSNKINNLILILFLLFLCAIYSLVILPYKLAALATGRLNERFVPTTVFVGSR